METKKTTTGKSDMREPTFGSLTYLYDEQAAFQRKITGAECPIDSINWFSYHIQAMVEELGEVMKADKRWKTHRNGHYDKPNKVEEIADMFVTVLNIAMYSDISKEQLFRAVENKIKENNRKWDERNKT